MKPFNRYTSGLLYDNEPGSGGGTGGAPNANTTKVFSQAEVDDLVTRARRDEKDKLYSDLERAKKAATDKDELLKQKEKELADAKEAGKATVALEQQVKDLQTGLEAANKKADEFAVRYDKIVDDALTRQRTDMETAFTTRDVATYKQSLIDSSDGKIIPELVTGNTKEEVKASFDKAKARYDEITTKAAAEKETELRTKYKGALPAPVVPPGQSSDSQTVADTSFRDFRKMSAADQKTEIAKYKKKAYEEAGIPMRS